MGVESLDFKNHGPLPSTCSADGGNVSPELHWASVPPAGTKSFVLVLEDPDAPGERPFVHWLVYSIPGNIDKMAAGQIPAGAVLGRNDAGTDAYFGPKPPSGTHHYVFRIYAISTTLELPGGASEGQLIKAMAPRVLGMGEIVGTFSH
jgi:Raf kinase inhibitor-like YbhB/YbcL family protein